MKQQATIIPNHIAIIPDGNRRWAKERNLDPWVGHEVGAKRAEELIEKALELGVKYLSFWGSSEDNLRKRPLAEKRALLKIYEDYFKKLIKSKEVFENEARIEVVGRWKEQFPQNLSRVLSEGIEKTKNHSKCFLTFLLAYNGDDDVIHAVNGIARDSQKKEIGEMTGDKFKSYLLSSELPDVDLLIRTGVQGDPHNSAGFLMWQTRNSQYYFSKKMYPDFSPDLLEDAILDFSKRVRRFGK